MAHARGEELQVGRRRFELPRPDKVLFPDAGITKADLVAYYRDVAEVMLPHIRGRPLMLQRCPDGVRGSCFYQKQSGRHFPDWMRTVDVPKAGGQVRHVVCDDEATLAYLAGQACVTLHAFLSRADRLERPDRIVFDFDPPGTDFPAVRAGARAAGQLLEELGLAPFVATTGSRGLHVVVPIERRHDFDATRAFARQVARLLAADDQRLTTEARKDRRRGRVFVDVMRNAYAQTAVAPYAVRTRPGAPVATPIGWEELDDPRLAPDRVHLGDVRRRLDRRGDPWAELEHRSRSIAAAMRRVDELAARRAS